MAATPPVALGGGTAVGMLESLGGRHVARATNGTIWMIVSEVSSVTYYLVAYFVDKNSVAAVREVITSGAVGYVGISVCVDTDDMPVVAYTRAGVTGIDVYRRESGTWTSKTGFTTNNSSGIEAHQIMCREDGTFDCVYTNHRSSTSVASIFHRVNTVDLGGAWAAQTTVDSVSTTNTGISLARRCAAVMDHAGTIHAAWVLHTATSWPIKYATYSGGSWSALETIHTPPTNIATYSARHLSIAVNASNVPVVAYARQTRESFAGITGIFLTHRTGGVWSTPDQVHATVESNQTMPSVTIDQQGDLQVFWRGDKLVSTLGYDSIYRAYGTVSSLSVERVADIGASLIQPEIPFAWEPFGHGFPDNGWWIMFGRSGSPPSIAFDGEVAWVHEPKCGNALAQSVSGSKSGTNQPGANVISIVQSLGLTRAINAFAENFILFAQHVFAPFAANRISLAQTVSIAGSVYRRTATNTLALSQTAIRESPVSCETDYEPTPALNASDSASASTSFAGPWPSLSRKIKMPLPKYGDSRGVDLRVTTLRTRHGETYQSIRSGTLREFVVSWSQLSRLKALEIRDFLDAMTGQEILWTDANGHRWRVLAVDREARLRATGVEYGNEIEVSLSGELLT